jgi:hypothetical protein
MKKIFSDNSLPRYTVCMLAAVLCCGAGSLNSWPCDSTVRGQAFVEPRDVHRLCVISDGQDSASQALFSQLAQWLAGPGLDMNLDLVRLDARDPNVKWEDYGIPSAPPDLPVVMLAGYQRASRRSFVIAHWEPGPTDTELEALRSSPVREGIQRDVGKQWAVLLYAPATAGSAGNTSEVLQSVVETWADKRSPGISVVHLDRADPSERVLVSFIGLPPLGPDWVGIVFGRGKLMAPPLEGSEITEAALDKLLCQLTEVCSCLRPPSLLGVDIPMAWNLALDKSVVSLLPPGAEQALTISGSPLQDEEEKVRPTSRLLVAATLSAIGFSLLAVLGTTLAIVRREKRRNAVPVSRK